MCIHSPFPHFCQKESALLYTVLTLPFSPGGAVAAPTVCRGMARSPAGFWSSAMVRHVEGSQLAVPGVRPSRPHRTCPATCPAQCPGWEGGRRRRPLVLNLVKKRRVGRSALVLVALCGKDPRPDRTQPGWPQDLGWPGVDPLP